jgi:hypothetical protein
MVILIGLPRCATTSIEMFMRQQGMRVAHSELSELLSGDLDADFVRAESVADSIQFKCPREKWHRLMYVPGAWDQIKDDLVIDPFANAKALKACYPDAKILLITREHADWMKSVYRYSVGQLPWFSRSYVEYLLTPSGMTHYMIDSIKLQAAYSCFELMVLPFEDLLCEPEQFMHMLCSFAGAKEGTLPKVNQSFNATVRRVFPFPLPKPVKRFARSVLMVH